MINSFDQEPKLFSGGLFSKGSEEIPKTNESLFSNKSLQQNFNPINNENKPLNSSSNSFFKNLAANSSSLLNSSTSPTTDKQNSLFGILSSSTIGTDKQNSIFGTISSSTIGKDKQNSPFEALVNKNNPEVSGSLFSGGNSGSSLFNNALSGSNQGSIGLFSISSNQDKSSSNSIKLPSENSSVNLLHEKFQPEKAPSFTSSI